LLMKPAGVLVAEHSTDMILQGGYNKLVSRQTRTYGDSAISIFELLEN